MSGLGQDQWTGAYVEIFAHRMQSQFPIVTFYLTSVISPAFLKASLFFSNVDLVRVYKEILMTEEDIPMTTITKLFDLFKIT